MKHYFERDFKRIGHAIRVARYAEQIGKKEQGNLAVVLTASYLYDIGIKEAEQKHRSTAGRYQEQEGPLVARELLARLGARAELIEEVCDIIGHHHPRAEESINFKSVYDANMIANLEEKQKKDPTGSESMAGIIEKSFLTERGRDLAKHVLLKERKG